METSNIAGAMLLMKTTQTQVAMSTSLVRMAADRQNQVVNLLAQGTQQAAPPAPADGSSVFSTYA